jgi:magnesium and cobalt transporter
MNDNSQSKRSTWLQRLKRFFVQEPTSRQELIQTLRKAKQRNILHQDDLSMFEGVLQVSQMRAQEIMIPRSQMVVIEKEAPLEDIVKLIIDSAHSRYPVIGDRRDEVIGIVLAKDLLLYAFGKEKEFQIRDLLRPASFVPVNKRLNVLLTEFRQTHNHIAMVVDEYGGVMGLITIEDVLEQIVGDIADEHDIDEDAFIRQQESNVYTVKAITDLERFNETFNTKFENNDCDTIGGLVLKEFGHLPKRGEHIRLDPLKITVLHSDNRRIHLLRVNIGTTE